MSYDLTAWHGDEEQPEEGQVMEYRHWDPETSIVVSGPYGTRFRFPGKRFPTRRAARRYWLMRAGRILEEHRVDGRWIFRVPRSYLGRVEGDSLCPPPSGP